MTNADTDTLRLDFASDVPGTLPATHLVVVHDPHPFDLVLFDRVFAKLATDLAILREHGD